MCDTMVVFEDVSDLDDNDANEQDKQHLRFAPTWGVFDQDGDGHITLEAEPLAILLSWWFRMHFVPG